MFCPKCGKQNQDTDKFCRNCGKPLPVRPPAGMPPPPAPVPAGPEKTEAAETRGEESGWENKTIIDVPAVFEERPAAEVKRDEIDFAATVIDVPERNKNAAEGAAASNDDRDERPPAFVEEETPEPEKIPPGDFPARQPDKKPAEQFVQPAPARSGIGSGGGRTLLVIGIVGIAAVLILGAIIGLAWLLWPKAQTPPPANAATGNSAAEETAAPNEPPPGMAYVPGGEFMLGTDESIDQEMLDTPAHKVSVKPFFIDLTEVTNEEYRKFITATGHKPPPDWKNGNYPAGKAKFPVTGVDWVDASAYAKWAGKRLPTEEEWEFAARGTDGRLYPWGNEWKKEFANADKQKEGTAEVGRSSGRSPFGLSDMSGNAWEWTASDAKAYPNGKKFQIESPDPKVIRGGYFGSPKEKSGATIRRPYGASGEAGGYANTGFRCVKDVPGNQL